MFLVYYELAYEHHFTDSIVEANRVLEGLLRSGSVAKVPLKADVRVFEAITFYRIASQGISQ